ncbi:MAG: hemolysin III family protein [Ruminococcaceae bacterium]|nr:hemolysin III family protein [Oscillospiraceae bacterium]
MTDKTNNQTLGEEIANAITHGLGALLAIAATAVAIVYSCFVSDALGIVSSAIYGFTLIVMYVNSTIYHSLKNNKAKRVFRIFDHCSIFLLIFGTYTPIALSLIRGWLGWTVFGVLLTLTILGVVFNSINLKKWEKASLVLYLLMGWMAIFILKPIFDAVGINGMLFLILGGVFYTVGVIFYKLKIRYMHPLWHLFVIGGSTFHYFFILFYALPIK